MRLRLTRVVYRRVLFGDSDGGFARGGGGGGDGDDDGGGGLAGGRQLQRRSAAAPLGAGSGAARVSPPARRVTTFLS